MSRVNYVWHANILGPLPQVAEDLISKLPVNNYLCDGRLAIESSSPADEDCVVAELIAGLYGNGDSAGDANRSYVFDVHRIVVASSSDFFRAMWRSGKADAGKHWLGILQYLISPWVKRKLLLVLPNKHR